MIILNLVLLSLKGYYYDNEVFWFELIFETPVASGVAGRTNVEICHPSSFFSQQIESVPIQLAQCRFPGLAVSNAEILVYFWKNYTDAILSNSTRKMLCFEITKVLKCSLRKKTIVSFITIFGALSFPVSSQEFCDKST